MTVVERHMPQMFSTLSHAEMTELMRRVQNHSRIMLIRAPKVTLFNGQTATIQDTVQRPFVVGLQRISLPGQPARHQPRIHVVTEGTTIRLRPVLHDGNCVRLNCWLSLSSVRNVETTSIPRGAGEEPLALQVPEVASIHVDTSLDMKLDETLLIGGLQQRDTNGKTQGMMVMLTTREIIAEPEP